MTYPQAMRPSGLIGRPFGWLMEMLNRPVYRAVFAALDPPPRCSLLEIGFGTGGFLELFAERAEPVRVAGVDPSELMLDTARARLARYPGIADGLFLGDDRSIAELSGTFDYIVSIHAFQFWEDPEYTLGQARQLANPGGRICLALRRHKQPAPPWLPNALSRRADEAEATCTLLRKTGFRNPQIVKTLAHTILLMAVRS